MKKLALAMMFGAAAVSANAQISSVQMQVACNPQDVKTYDIGSSPGWSTN